MKTGRIFSVETMGLVDGPGIRTVIFMQGCCLRCKFCHNPESWDKNCGEIIDTHTLIKKIMRFKPYFQRSNGGVTFSGGEPLLQPEFLAEMLRLCKEMDIHTCIDTSGVGYGDYQDILANTDLILYDVKALDSEGYRYICGGNISDTERFLEAVRHSQTPVTVRQVVIPGINDNDNYMEKLKEYIAEKIPTAEKVELLPYHKLGVHKYTDIGIPYLFSTIEQMDKNTTEQLYRKHFEGA